MYSCSTVKHVILRRERVSLFDVSAVKSRLDRKNGVMGANKP